MFWRRKGTAVVVESQPSEPAQDPDLDQALEATAEILRSRARHALPSGDDDVERVSEVLEQWAAHILVKSPPPRFAVGREPLAEGARDFRGLVDYVETQSRKEHAWVTSSSRDMRDAIFALVESFRVASLVQGQHDRLLNAGLSNLNQALEAGAFDTLKREARQVAKTMSHVLEEQRAMAERQANELRDRLTALGEQLEQRRREGETDPLTRIANRRAFDGHLPRALTMASVLGRPMTLMMVDVDHFKSVNDTHGHPVGDDVLRAVADAIAKAFPRRSDLVSRYGGEEFAIVLADAGMAEAPMLHKRLLDAIRAVRVVVPGHGELRVRASAGLAINEPEESVSSIIARADGALYGAKRSGRDCAVIAAARGAESQPDVSSAAA